MKRALYFAYGSNLDPAQMRRRCPRAVPGRRATLDGYRIAFGGHSRTWGGPVATLVKDPDDGVDGLLYELPHAELAVLDRYEGHPFAYRRKLLLVTDETGRRRRAYVYVLPVAEEAPPAPDYLGVLWQAYRRLGFDREPLARALRTGDLPVAGTGGGTPSAASRILDVPAGTPAVSLLAADAPALRPARSGPRPATPAAGGVR